MYIFKKKYILKKINTSFQGEPNPNNPYCDLYIPLWTLTQKWLWNLRYILKKNKYILHKNKYIFSKRN